MTAVEIAAICAAITTVFTGFAVGLRFLVKGWLNELRLPTLVIVGDKDKSTKPSDSVVLWEGIPNSEFCVLPGCAHGAHLEKPDLFNLVVANFLCSALINV